jgi:hypothetical protein
MATDIHHWLGAHRGLFADASTETSSQDYDLHLILTGASDRRLALFNNAV